MNDLRQKLSNVQQELKAPKSQYNKFAKFAYRNQEDILEALKPLLKREGLILTLSDEVVNIGSANYVQATATITGIDPNSESIVVTAYAREEVSLKGQIAAQITGGASSYARKYALNGLFNIDDSNDVDSHDNTKHVSKPVEVNKPDPLAKAKDELNKMLESYGHDNNVKKKVVINSVLKKSTVDSEAEANDVMQALTDGTV